MVLCKFYDILIERKDIATMNQFYIFTDSACDIKPEILQEWGVGSLSLNFRFNGDETLYSDNSMPIGEFYNKMREGMVAKTSAVNSETFAQAFDKILAEGNDLLYLGFSSGLSTTFNSGRLAAEQMREKYPERKIIVIDTLAASAGFGLLVYLAVQKKNEGASIEETAEYAKSLIFRLCHWFTVDDLVYLKRGGRVSPTAAFVGNMLGIKPVLHVDNEGHLINMSKVRGRKTALNALASKIGELEADIENYPIFISHGDCMADVEILKKMILDKYGKEVKLVTDVGAVIGAHAGPGVMALFFIARER